MPNPGLVVVGASLAGLRTVQAARKAGYSDPITLLGAEEHLPYDRPPLSKAYLAATTEPPVDPTFPAAAGLGDLGVKVRLGQHATGLDRDAHEILLDTDRVPFDDVVIATGSTARTLPGTNLPGVHVLRTLDDARAIRAALEAGARTVVIGGGFIGAEIASAAQQRGTPVTIIEAAPLPLIHAVGEQMAGMLATLHAHAGVELRCGTTAVSITGDQRVEQVQLSDGSALDTDLVVVGIGATPATDWLTGSGLHIDDGVVCDATLRAADHIYAAGDVCRWHNPLFDESMRLEHWTSAAEQGTAAGRNLHTPDTAPDYSTVPYFWSDWYEHKIQMVGIPNADDTLVTGAPDEHRWIALYRRADRLIGALSLNQPGKIMKYRALIARQASWHDALDFAGAPTH